MKGKSENATGTSPQLPGTTYDANTGKFRTISEGERVAWEQRANRRRNRGAGSLANWRDADAAKVLDAIVAITSFGFAVRFGYTKDGGAFAVGVIGDGEPYTEFTRPTEDIDLYLDDLCRDYRGHPATAFSAGRE